MGVTIWRGDDSLFSQFSKLIANAIEHRLVIAEPSHIAFRHRGDKFDFSVDLDRVASRCLQGPIDFTGLAFSIIAM